MKKNITATMMALSLLMGTAVYSNLANVENSAFHQNPYRHHAIGIDVGTLAGADHYAKGWGGFSGGVNYNYNFNPYIGIEARITGFSLMFTDGYQASLTAVGTYPVSTNVDVIGKVGFGCLYKKDDFLLDVFSKEYKVPGLGLGIGVGYHLNRVTEMTIEYNGLLVKENQLRGESSLIDHANAMFGELTVGVSYHL